MAYQYYNPYYQQQMPQPIQQQMPQPIQQQMQQPMPQQVQQPQIQATNFVTVPSEDVARNYPVAPGNSVTFKNENAPYVYSKTMGFSQLDRPIFEKYRLVKEDDVEPIKADPKEDENLKSKLIEMDKMKEEIEFLKAEIEDLKMDSHKILEEINKKPSKKKDGE